MNKKNIFYVILIIITGMVIVSPVLSQELILPDSGQELCYDWEKIICDEWHVEGLKQVCDSLPYCPEEGDDFYGQDAIYTINPPNLTNNENGTVFDNITGLTWEQKTETIEAYTFTFDDAVAYCNDLTLGEQTAWRVPTRKEFSTLLNFGTVSPALDTAYFPDYTYMTGDDMSYWTATEYHDNSTMVWKVLISFGLMNVGFKAPDPPVLSKVRCVLGNTLPDSSYVDNGDSTVTDTTTGLMWEQKTDDGGSRDKDNTYTWLEALSFCENLVLSGFTDWRIPNPKELERLVDLGESSPAVDTDFFPKTSNGRYWTGTTCSGCHKKVAFTVDYTDGELYKGNKVFNDDTHESLYVRAVRSGPCGPPGDSDHDGICDDGDNSTVAGDNPCTGGNTVFCDDNCPDDINAEQADVNADGVGDICETSQPCLVERLFEKRDSRIVTIRRFRDEVLYSTGLGREMINLYYRESDDMIELVKDNPVLRIFYKQSFETLIPVMEIMLDD